MTLFVAALAGGLAIGAVLALVVLGMVLIFRATHTFNFAHGHLMLIPAYLVGMWQSNHGMNFFLAACLAIGAAGLIAALLYRFVLHKMVGMPLFIPVIATLGFAAVLDAFIGVFFRSNLYNITIPSIPSGAVRIADVRLTWSLILLSTFAYALGIAVAAYIRFTRVGSKIRAAGQDSLLASQGGINVRRIYLGSWVMAAVLAAIAGITYGSTNVVSTSMLQLAFLAFPALLLGGFDSIPGALLGGTGVGMVQSFTSAYLGSDLVNLTTYSLLLVVLLWRPQGFMGTLEVTRV